jgi:hypothetical protein
MITVKLVKFDSVSKRFVAEMTVTEDLAEYRYRCEGLWSEGCEAEIAKVLYSQHAERVACDAKLSDVEVTGIEAKIVTEATKFSTAEVKP